MSDKYIFNIKTVQMCYKTLIEALKTLTDCNITITIHDSKLIAMDSLIQY